MKKVFVLVALTMGMSSTSQVSAQATFGEFVDQGAKKVLKEEWVSILPASIYAPARTGQAFLVFHPNGTLSGEFTSNIEGKSPITGTWTMDASGKRCIDEYFSAWRSSWQECSYMYKLNGSYYGTPTDSDRSAKVRNPPIAYKIKVR